MLYFCPLMDQKKASNTNSWFQSLWCVGCRQLSSVKNRRGVETVSENTCSCNSFFHPLTSSSLFGSSPSLHLVLNQDHFWGQELLLIMHMCCIVHHGVLLQLEPLVTTVVQTQICLEGRENASFKTERSVKLCGFSSILEYSSAQLVLKEQ